MNTFRSTVSQKHTHKNKLATYAMQKYFIRCFNVHIGNWNQHPLLLLRSTYCSFNYFCCRCFYCCCCFRLKSMCLIVEPCLMATAAIRDSNPTQLEGKVSWLLSLEWSNVGRGAIITGIHHHPVTRVNNISSIGICLHLRTIHQVAVLQSNVPTTSTPSCP